MVTQKGGPITKPTGLTPKSELAMLKHCLSMTPEALANESIEMQLTRLKYVFCILDQHSGYMAEEICWMLQNHYLPLPNCPEADNYIVRERQWGHEATSHILRAMSDPIMKAACDNKQDKFVKETLNFFKGKEKEYEHKRRTKRTLEEMLKDMEGGLVKQGDERKRQTKFPKDPRKQK